MNPLSKNQHARALQIYYHNPASGGSFDFTCGTLKIPYSFAIELPDTGPYGFLLPPSFIVQIGEQMWDVLQVFVEEMK
ncbi:hypothetical protein ACTXT7_006621 [Hymenolepis weldensis]